MIDLYNGDCIEVFDTLLEKGTKVDCVLTSPPYDNLREYGEKFTEWNESKWKQVLLKIKDILVEGGVCVWIVNDATINGSETGTSFKQALYAIEIGLNLHDTMIWEKPHFSNPSSNRCHQIFEYMFIFSKGKPRVFNQILDVPIKYGKPLGKGSQRHKNGDITNKEVTSESKEFGSRKNIWKINTAGQENFGKKVLHPAQFSLQLVKDHLFTWTNPYDTVLDCFMGSGTTAIGCLETNRKFIGIELEPKYFEIAKERIAEVEKGIYPAIEGWD